MDGDPAREIVLASGLTYSGSVAVIDSVTLIDQWRIQPQGFSFISDIELIRFNADAVDDIVAAGDGRFVILDGVNGTELFRSVSFQTDGPIKLAVGQTDADIQHEVILGVGTNAYVIDPIRGLVESFLSSSTVMHGLKTEMHAGDCLIIATLSNRIERRRCDNGQLDSQRVFGIDAQWTGIPVDSFGPLVLSDGRYLHRLEGATLTAKSAALGNAMGARNQGVARMDGANIVVWIGGAQAVHRVTLPLETSLFANSFERP
jgi:hypothetical protein